MCTTHRTPSFKSVVHGVERLALVGVDVGVEVDDLNFVAEAYFGPGGHAGLAERVVALCFDGPAEEELADWAGVVF